MSSGLSSTARTRTFFPGLLFRYSYWAGAESAEYTNQAWSLGYLRPRWKCEGEAGSEARPIAFSPDASPVRLHYPLADGQAQDRCRLACSSGCARGELAEQARQGVSPGMPRPSSVTDSGNVDAVPGRRSTLMIDRLRGVDAPRWTAGCKGPVRCGLWSAITNGRVRTRCRWPGCGCVLAIMKVFLARSTSAATSAGSETDRQYARFDAGHIQAGRKPGLCM